MATKTTKRKPTLKFGVANNSIKTEFKFPPEWEKRFTELEQELHRRTDSRTGQSGVVYPDNTTTGQGWAKQEYIVPKGTVHELAADVNLNANEVKQLVINIKNKLTDKLGNLPVPETKTDNKETLPGFIAPIEAELLAAKSELAQIYSLLTQINDLQEVKL